MVSVAIVDYGMGNLRSVAGAVEKIGHSAQISRDPDVLSNADKLILPGVGAFGDAIRNLQKFDLIEPLNDLVRNNGKPILGICLGAQLTAHSSDEFGDHDGLGWLPARVHRIEPRDTNERVPHVGWNELTQTHDSVLFENIPPDALFYYVHSHCLHADNEAVVAGTCDFGNGFAAVLQQGNVYATQFHPEKSQQHGLNLLTNFVERG